MKNHSIKVMDGYNRIQSMNGESINFNRVGYQANSGTPPTMQGFNRIMQGYAMGDEEDLEDWNFLIDIEHPITMNGFPAYLEMSRNDPMNGKRKDKRRAKKEARKARKQTKRAKKTAKKDAKEQRKQDKKNLRLAKKEEKLLRKQQNREQRKLDKEARRARKQQRLDDRSARKDQRFENRSARREDRMSEGGLFDTLKDIGGDVGAALVQNLGTGQGLFAENTFSDFNSLPPQFESFVDDMQDVNYQTALNMRDQMEDDGAIDPDAKPPKQGSMMLPLAIGAALLLATQSNNNSKRK